MTFFSKHYVAMLIVPAFFSLVAIAALGAWGLRPAVDLSGGSLLQVSFREGRPSVTQVEEILKAQGYPNALVQPTATSSYTISTATLTNAQKNAIESSLQKLGSLKEQQFTSISPSIGAEVLHKGILAIVLVVVCIILFIAYAFRKVSEPVASWKYGIVAIVTLVHDILIPAGMFAILGALVHAEVDSLFIVALLTVLGISINDTIVVFDRVRENLRFNAERRTREEFSETVGRSINQTLTRSINTSVTVIVVLAALYVLGPATTKDFALTLIVGMIAGTYSSMLLACPLVVLWERHAAKNQTSLSARAGASKMDAKAKVKPRAR